MYYNSRYILTNKLNHSKDNKQQLTIVGMENLWITGCDYLCYLVPSFYVVGVLCVFYCPRFPATDLEKVIDPTSEPDHGDTANG